ncbi:MAG: hypothetical protein J6J74_01770 [Elusimicrobiaceae bacterium]|nr:hypothetical protein [Elusimicrobiaceae bacterium]
MNQLTYLVSLKAFFEKDNDYISAFSYITLQVLVGERQTLTQIQEQILQRFSINIPTAVIKTCLRRLRRMGITSLNEMSILTERGDELLQNIRIQMENVNREINALIGKIQIYLQAQKLTVTDDDILNHLIQLIQSKTQELASGFKNIRFEDNEDANSLLTRKIVHFLIEVEEKDPISFKTLRDIGQGVILHSIVNKENPDKLSESFSKLTVFLDTNVVFGLLNLADTEVNIACREIISLMQQQKHIEIRVFPFTVDEIRNFIDTQIRLHDNMGFPYGYLSGARKILAHKTKTELKILQDNFVRYLNKDFGIIESKDYSGNLYTSEDTAALNKVKTDIDYPHKDPSQFSLEHDTNAYQWIKKLRGGKVYSLEDAKYIFLTLDNKLFRWVSNKHKNSRPEVILMDAFTAVLWIKTPNMDSNLPIHNLIAGCREKLLIRKEVWDTIISALKKYKNLQDYGHDPVSIRILQSRSMLEQIEGVSQLTDEDAIICIKKVEEEIQQREKFKDNKIKNLIWANKEIHKELELEIEEKKNYVIKGVSLDNKLNHIINSISEVVTDIFIIVLLLLLGAILYLLLFTKLFAENITINLGFISAEKCTYGGFGLIILTLGLLLFKYRPKWKIWVTHYISFYLSKKFNNDTK